MTPAMRAAAESSRHRPWQGEDAPDRCVVCDRWWPCITAYEVQAAALAEAEQGGQEERVLADRLAHAYEAALRYLDNDYPIPGLVAGSRVAGSEVLNEWRAARGPRP